jgi:hypothetical protein
MYTLLHKPLSKESIRTQLDAAPNEHIRGVVAVELSDLIDNYSDGVLDLLSEKLTGTELLTDIHYKIVGFAGETTLHVEVSGDLSQINLDDDSA